MNDILLQLVKAKKKCQDLILRQEQGNDQIACYYESHTSWDYVTVRTFYYTSLFFYNEIVVYVCYYIVYHMFLTHASSSSLQWYSS